MKLLLTSPSPIMLEQTTSPATIGQSPWMTASDQIQVERRLCATALVAVTLAPSPIAVSPVPVVVHEILEADVPFEA
jgi:hypothetical protein